jgi:hypothetical protein
MSDVLSSIKVVHGLESPLREAPEVLCDVRMLDRKIVDLGTRVEAEVEASGTAQVRWRRGVGHLSHELVEGEYRMVGRHGPQTARRRRRGRYWYLPAAISDLLPAIL